MMAYSNIFTFFLQSKESKPAAPTAEAATTVSSEKVGNNTVIYKSSYIKTKLPLFFTSAKSKTAVNNWLVLVSL